MEHLFDTIYTRKSVRKFDSTPLSDETIGKIRDEITALQPLDDSIHYAFEIFEKDHVKARVKAPHYLCLYSEQKDHFLMNAGYVMAQMDLIFSMLGVGSCWLGTVTPLEETKDGLPYVIMLAFGGPAEELRRTSVSEFKRKQLDSFSSLEGCGELIAPVRFAPSAMNSQPWVFSQEDKQFVISRRKPGLKAPFLARLNQIDIGIALCYFQISAMHMGKTAKFGFDPLPAPHGCIFMASATIDNFK
jgi:hypothetical protein